MLVQNRTIDLVLNCDRTIDANAQIVEEKSIATIWIESVNIYLCKSI